VGECFGSSPYALFISTLFSTILFEEEVLFDSFGSFDSSFPEAHADDEAGGGGFAPPCAKFM